MPNLSLSFSRALPLVLCAAAFPLTPAQAQTAPKPAKVAKPGTYTLPPNAKGPEGTVPLGQLIVPQNPMVDLFNRAIAATNAKKYAEAERLYRLILKTEPDAAAVWANLGLLQAYQGNITGAENSLATAVKNSPKTTMFRAQLASLQFRRGKIAAADTNARRVLKQEPKNLLALATLSDILMRQKRYADAVPLLQNLRSLSKTPDSRTNINLILALNGSGKTAQAVPLARKQVAQFPKQPASYLALGDTLRLANDLDGAKAAYARAGTLDPKNGGAAAGLSVVAALSGDSTTALKLLNQRISKNPNDPVLRFQRGFLFYKAADTMPPDSRERRTQLNQAEQEFYQAATLDPKNAQYLTYTGMAGVAQGEERFKGAEAMFRSALNLQPRNTMARMGLAYIAEKQGKGDIALKQYQAILSYDQKSKQAHRGVAGVYYATGKKDAAYKEMRGLALADKRDTLVLSELGSWLSADKRTVEAQAVYQQILMRDPKDEAAYLALGRLAMEGQPPQPAQAVRWYRDALAHIPDSTNAAMLLGQALVADNKKDEAMEVFRKLLAADPGSNPVRWQYAVMLHQAGNDDESLKQMRAIQLVSNDPNRISYLLGPPRLLLEQKKYPEAIASLRQLRQENSKDDDVAYTLAEALRQGGQVREAEAVLIQLRERKPTREEEGVSVRPALLLGGLYEDDNRLDDAANSYEAALQTDPTNLTAVLGLQRVRERQNKPEAAREFLEQMALSSPKEPLLPAVGSLRQLHLSRKTLPQYTEFTQRLLQKYPNDWTTIYIRAQTLTDQTVGDVTPAARQEAVGLYKQILAKDKKNVDAQTQLAAQYEALKQNSEAVAAYQEILKWDARNAQALEGLKRLGVTPPPAPTAERPVGAAPTPETGKAVTRP